MRTKQRIVAVAVIATGLQGMALAADAQTQDVSCTIFPPAQIVPGQDFDLRVSRVPGYPGGWFSPTILIKLTYPTQPGWAFSQTEQKTIPKMGAIRTDFSLKAPFSLYPDPLGGFIPGGTVNILAIVVEPTTGAPRKTLCTGSTTIAN